jgi:hypothetical protein
MEDILADFEKTGTEYKKIRFYILCLSYAIVFILIIINIFIIVDNSTFDWELFPLIPIEALLTAGPVFLFAKGNQLGWYFLLFNHCVLFGFFLKTDIRIITWSVTYMSAFHIGLVLFLTADALISILLLYNTAIRKSFEIGTLFSFVWGLICALAIFACYFITS